MAIYNAIIIYTNQNCTLTIVGSKIAFINNTKKLFVFDSNNPNDHLTIKYIAKKYDATKE